RGIRGGEGGDGELSRQIVQGLGKDKNLDAKAVTLPEARDAVRRGNAVVAVAIPKGFGAEAGKAFFRPGKKPELLFLYDPTRQAELDMVRGILTQHVMQTLSASAFGSRGDLSVLRAPDPEPN